MKMVCPNPKAWNRIYQALEHSWRESGASGEKPPVPLILNGWVYSNDIEKHERWNATIQWAEKRGVAELIPKLRDDEVYSVEIFSADQVGPMGGTMYLPWSFDSKSVPRTAELAAALGVISANWSTIVGSELASVTKPLRFSGKKGRRLVVTVVDHANPPWGAWNKLADDESRRTLTSLRTRINEAIAPHMVDHVDFV